jgi:hypothetical protein
MQSKRHSLMEAALNVLIGYWVAIATQMAVFPLFGIHIPLEQDLLIGLLFTVVSLVRSYALRRVFNRWHERKPVYE